MRITTLSVIVAAALLSACGDGAGPEGTAPFAIKFGTRTAPAGSAPWYARASGFGAAGAAAQDQLTITGTNGTLVISDIRVIVDEFELEAVEVADCDVKPKPPGCVDFEARFLFVDVPLGGAPVTVVTDEVPPGLYDELEFEVERLDLNSDDPDDAEEVALATALLDSIRTKLGFPDWPDRASMVVVGTFTPADGGAPVPFTVHLDAEIEVELEFDPPLEVREGTSTAVVIQLSPEVWFKRADGTVMDLSAFDFATTGKLLDFELEIEDHGFELEIER